MRGVTRGIRRAATAGVAAAGLALLPAVANATPGTGVTGVIISQTTAGGKDYILREVTIQPGGKTGWHFHDGTLYAFVAQGTLTHPDSSCDSSIVYKTGAAFVEPSGANHVHEGINLGKKPVVLEVLYVLPHGAPLSEDAPNPGCDF
ncbi:cupin domain-containing protein [Kribbella sp. NBC_00382]|uniref:cupin domain-containing protein n=1 Tax=Kribbella sp. NBC_00382 TaxID=2975967 RepID=UPI002E1C0D12